MRFVKPVVGLVVVGALGLSLSGRAEMPVAPQGYPVPMGPQPIPPTMKTFDDDFFDPASPESAPPEAQVDSTGKARYVDRGYGEYNSAQYEEWKAICQGFKQEPDKYRDCFRKQRDESKQRAEQAEQAVQNKQSQKQRNVPRGRKPTGTP